MNVEVIQSHFLTDQQIANVVEIIYSAQAPPHTSGLICSCLTKYQTSWKLPFNIRINAGNSISSYHFERLQLFGEKSNIPEMPFNIEMDAGSISP